MEQYTNYKPVRHKTLSKLMQFVEATTKKSNGNKTRKRDNKLLTASIGSMQKPSSVR